MELFFPRCLYSGVLRYRSPVSGRITTNSLPSFSGLLATSNAAYAAAPADIKEAIELIRSRKINVKDMITHRLSLEETGKGFKIVADAEESIKVVVEPHR